MIQIIKGVVLDANDDPLADKDVEVQFAGKSGPGVRGKTNSSGAFAIAVENNSGEISTAALRLPDDSFHEFELDHEEGIVDLTDVTAAGADAARPQILKDPGVGVRLVTGVTEDTITAADKDGIVLYACDDPCDVEFDTGAQSSSFKCRTINNPNCDKVNFPAGSCASASGFFTIKAGGTVDITCPDAATFYLKGDLCQESTLFADLPGDPKIGDEAIITDADNGLAGAVIGGGGSETVKAWFTGANWRVMGPSAT